MEITEFSDYRTYLNEVLAERCSKNPELSLRSFAAKLGLSASFLSRVLSGQRKLSLATGLQISKKLKLSESAANYFASLIEIEHLPNDQERIEYFKNLSKRYGRTSEIIPIEQFKLISQWYHFAILSLSKTTDFNDDPMWMASRLGISPHQARSALERLVKMGFLSKTNGTYLALNNANIKTSEDFSELAIRENHKEQMKNAARALDEVNVDLREFINLAVNIDAKDVKKAKSILREFINRFNFEFDRNSSEDVFQLNLQFFPLTKINGEKGHA